MTELQLRFADHCIDQLFNAYPGKKSLSKRFENIEYDEAIIVINILKDKGFTIREGVRTRLTTWGYEIIQEHGSYSGYLKAIDENKRESKVKQGLETENLRLQNEKFTYEQTIREQEELIRELQLQLTKLNLLQKYWWVIFISTSIGIAIRGLLDKALG